MPQSTIRIAILTGNNSFAERHLVRLLRSEFKHVIVIGAKPSTVNRHTVRYAIGTAWRVIKLSAKRVFLNYRYSISPFIRPKPKADIEDVNINSEVVFRSVKEFNPDVICIYGTKKVKSRILELAQTSLNIHNGFVPYYRGVSSGHWVSLESNFYYLGYTIHKPTSTIDAGDVYKSEMVDPYFFESLADHQYRQSIVAANAILKIVKNIDPHNAKAFKQPDLGARNLKHIDKPPMFSLKAEQNFVSQNGKLYKLTTPRTGRIENFLVKSSSSHRPDKIADGWFIMNYHAIVGEQKFQNHDVPRIVTNLSRFKQHIDLYSNEFELISLSTGLNHLKSGSTENSKYLSITFDDSLKLSREVQELLLSKGIKPTLFINSDPVIHQKSLHNHTKYLNWLFGTLQSTDPYEIWVRSQYFSVEDVRRIADENIAEIGSHTDSHHNLNHLRFKDLEKQITETHKELERVLGRDINYFAFPYGGSRDRSFLAEYQAMKTTRHYFAQRGGVNRRSTRGVLLRVGVHNQTKSELNLLLRNQYIR
jgi:methionyl-tRNA formyltransferase